MGQIWAKTRKFLSGLFQIERIADIAKTNKICQTCKHASFFLYWSNPNDWVELGCDANKKNVSPDELCHKWEPKK